MTRGYVVTVEGKKIIKVAYLQSDAYPSYYGVRILDAFEHGDMEKWLDEQIKYNHACYGDEDPSQGFRLSWIMQTAETKKAGAGRYDFAEYGYLYNQNTKSLKVYHFGELLCTVTEGETEKYRFYFRNCDDIDSYLQYNPEKMAYENRPVKKVINSATLEELEGYLEKSKVPRPELEDSHLCLGGHNPQNGVMVYGKNFQTSGFWDPEDEGYQKRVLFICEKPFMSSSWNVLVQLPYMRVQTDSGLSSETAAVSSIRDTVRKVGVPKLLRFGEISNLLQEYYKNSTFEEMSDFLKNLQEEWEKAPWYTPAGHFTVAEITFHYRDRMYCSRTKEERSCAQ